MSGTTRFWTGPEGTLAYDDQGVGPLVVTVPSMGDLRQEYRFLTPVLVNAGYRVVNLEIRGMGESAAEGADVSVAGVGADLAGLIDHLKAGPAAVLADSMGAGAAVWAAATYPERVASLVLMGPFVRGEPTWWGPLVYGLLFRPFWGASAWVGYYGSLYPRSKPTDWDAYRQALQASLADGRRRKTLVRMIGASKGASERLLDGVKARALVVMGSKDPDFSDPEAEARWLGDRLRAPVHVVDGVGHYPHVEAVDEVAPVILGFLGA